MKYFFLIMGIVIGIGRPDLRLLMARIVIGLAIIEIFAKFNTNSILKTLRKIAYCLAGSMIWFSSIVGRLSVLIILYIWGIKQIHKFFDNNANSIKPCNIDIDIVEIIYMLALVGFTIFLSFLIGVPTIYKGWLR